MHYEMFSAIPGLLLTRCLVLFLSQLVTTKKMSPDTAVIPSGHQSHLQLGTTGLNDLKDHPVLFPLW